MNNFELYYENDEKRLEYMTRTPWLKNNNYIYFQNYYN